MLAKLGLLAMCQIPPKGNTCLDMEKKWNKVLGFYILISHTPSLEAKMIVFNETFKTLDLNRCVFHVANKRWHPAKVVQE